MLPLLALDAVDVRLGAHPALVGVDVSVVDSELTVVVGPNGAGKSTLLEVLAGVRAPSRGEVRGRARSVAFVPQRTAVAPTLPVTVRDLVAIGTWSRRASGGKLSRGERRRRVDGALERLDLVPLSHRPFSALSGGEGQRALLAQGLVGGAELLLVDEPTTGLDHATRDLLVEALVDEARRGVAVVCVTHDQAVVERADRVVRLEAGRVVHTGSAEG